MTEIINFIRQPEIVLAGALILLVVCMLLAARCKTLPVKGLFYVLATGFGVFGIWGIAKSVFSSGIKKEIALLEEKIKANEKALAEYKAKSDEADAAFGKALAELREAEEAYKKQDALLKAKSEAQREEINKLHGKELFDYITKNIP